MQRACQTIRPTGQFVRCLAGQGQRAAIQHVHHAGVAQQQGVGAEEGLVALGAGATSAIGGAATGTVGDSTASVRQRLLHARDPRGACALQVDVFRGLHLRAALDAQSHARVVARAFLRQQLAVPGVALGGGEAAGGLDAAQVLDLRGGISSTARRRRRSAARARRRAPPWRRGRRASVWWRRRSGSPAAGVARHLRAARISWASTASRTERVSGADRVQVVDSGRRLQRRQARRVS